MRNSLGVPALPLLPYELPFPFNLPFHRGVHSKGRSRIWLDHNSPPTKTAPLFVFPSMQHLEGDNSRLGSTPPSFAGFFSFPFLEICGFSRLDTYIFAGSVLSDPRNPSLFSILLSMQGSLPVVQPLRLRSGKWILSSPPPFKVCYPRSSKCFFPSPDCALAVTKIVPKESCPLSTFPFFFPFKPNATPFQFFLSFKPSHRCRFLVCLGVPIFLTFYL